MDTRENRFCLRVADPPFGRLDEVDAFVVGEGRRVPGFLQRVIEVANGHSDTITGA